MPISEMQVDPSYEKGYHDGYMRGKYDALNNLAELTAALLNPPPIIMKHVNLIDGQSNVQP